MIPFFRKIRKTLADDNKPLKYLRYAIGEIVLVVIGILIALQVNNWNELRKTNNENIGLIKVLESELESNILMANELIDFGYQFDSINSILIDKKLTRNSIKSPIIIETHFETNTSRFNDEHLNELIAIEKQLPKKYQSIIHKLKELKRLLESQKIWEKAVVDLAKQRRKEFVETLPWLYESDSISTEKAKDFILNDPIYRNKVIQYTNLQLEENIWDATIIRTMAIALLWDIKKMDPNDETDIKDYLKNKKLKPFETFDCEAKTYNTGKHLNFRTTFVLIKNNRKEITLNFIDKNKVITQSINLSPAVNNPSFIIREYYFGKVEFIEVVEENKCSKIYSFVKDGYLILE
jgi:hypothetical protein